MLTKPACKRELAVGPCGSAVNAGEVFQETWAAQCGRQQATHTPGLSESKDPLLLFLGLLQSAPPTPRPRLLRVPDQEAAPFF